MFDNNPSDSAVSPVVGVILMVAVTVILSAVIATFVLDLGSNTQQNPSAGVTFDEADGEVTVTAISMDNADELKIHVNGSYSGENITSVGESVSVDSTGTVSVVGILDGNEAVIQSYEPDTVSDGSASWSEPNEDAPSDLSSTLDDMDGEGTVGSPYVITNDHELQAMEADPSANYTLGNNIDASGTDQWNGGSGFEPIGELDHANEVIVPFNGSFDGDGYEISNLYIDRGSTGQVGLFSFTRGTIENTGVVDADVTGDNAVGALVGYQETGVVSDSYSTGEVSGNDGAVGGLVGELSSGKVVSDSYSTSDVNGEMWVGGLVGNNIAGTVEDSYATGSVVVTGDDGEGAGGLVGASHANTHINQSYATGGVEGEKNIGGLVGASNGASVSESYATGSADGSQNVGGLVGVNSDGMHGPTMETVNGTVDNSYATTDVSGSAYDTNLGGLVGSNAENASVSESYAAEEVTGSTFNNGLVGDNSGEVSASYWDVDSTNQDSSAGLPDENGLTTDEMQGDAASSNMNGFDWSNTWETVDGDYPELHWESE